MLRVKHNGQTVDLNGQTELLEKRKVAISRAQIDDIIDKLNELTIRLNAIEVALSRR